MLWAYDAEHLDFLERYVRASIREREPNRNGSLASRLPAWLKYAKSRDQVLACCATLRARLEQAATPGAARRGGRGSARDGAGAVADEDVVDGPPA
ncbi:hypothetical protein [Nonomuraea sp. SBT364]|uniref:hypothetical protein n=1 Tax=Nonomuraea sp. SBT364 TaxID=1580530 RepID=UPI00066E2886|nr:hypothetical protein [Nonomuraea sp. SBT364]